MVQINWLAIGAAVASTFVIGGLWYSPLLFVNPWLRMSGVQKRDFDSGLPKALVGDLFSATATALVLNQVIRWSGAAGVRAGLVVGFVIWVGFVLGVLLTQVTYQRRPVAFFLISAGYRLVALESMAAILSTWH